MQACASDNKLIRLAGGELPSAEREQVLSHLQSCPKCRAAWEELRAAWELLGQVEAVPPENDLAARVLKEAALTGMRGTRWAAVARVAAVVALAAGMGIAAGVLVPGFQYAYNAPSVSDEQIVEALGLDAMDAGTNLLTEVFEADDIGSGVDQEQPS